jgi:AAA family ATP:ADP antiporter
MRSSASLSSLIDSLKDYGYKKFFSISIILVLVCFNNHLLRSMKITCIMDIPEAGTELFSFFKTYGVFPVLFIFTSIYFYLIKIFEYKYVFCFFILIFLVYFLCFLCFFYPKSSLFEIASIEVLAKNWLPKGLYNFVLMIKYWHFFLFYILSEIWATTILSLMVWGVINDNTSLHESKIVYPIFLLIANSTGIFMGQVTQILTFEKRYSFLNYINSPWKQSFVVQLFIVSLLCCAIIIIYLKSNSLLQKKLNHNPKKDNKNTNFKNVLTLFITEKTVLSIAILAFSYNMIYNLFEIIWLNQIKLIYPYAGDLNLYLGQITKYTSLLSTIMSVILILLGNKINISYNWIIKASLSPFSCFLLTSLFTLSWYQVFSMFTTSQTLFFGSCQIILGRVLKYTVFDETKESAFIILPQNTRRESKPIIDLFSFKFGQLASNIIIQILTFVFLSISSIVPYLISIIFIVNFIWFVSVTKLWKELKNAKSSVIAD